MRQEKKEGKMMRRALFTMMLLLASCRLSLTAALADDFIQAQSAIGIETTASGGRYTISEAAEICRANGIDILITTDSFSNRWQYGYWPLRRLIKRTEETRSVLSSGVRRYLADLEKAREENPGIVIIGGIETAPFYYWKGLPYRRGFSIRDWHKHMLVFGLDSAEDYRRLPVIGNDDAQPAPGILRPILSALLPLMIIAVGLACLYIGRYARKGIYERAHALPLLAWRRLGIAVFAAGLLLFINNFHFRHPRYDQYHGYQGPAPYQTLIDYANSHKALTFWAHPEAGNVEKTDFVEIRTEDSSDSLFETTDYTGFAIFYEGYKRIGRPGGIWDDLLNKYCSGKRHAPVWAIGVLDFEKGQDLAQELANLRTVLLVEKLGSKEALEALGSGRIYVARDANASKFVMDDFSVSDQSSWNRAVAGQELALSTDPSIRIAGRFTDGQARIVKIILIKDGGPFKYFEVTSPFDIKFEDEEVPDGARGYYRVELRSDGLVFVANPIFVKRKASR